MTQETPAPDRRHLANPEKVDTFRAKAADSTTGTAQPGTELLQTIVETPRGSRNKYSFDVEQRLFALKTVLPLGMVFPLDFGFIPRTRGGNGDPLDVLILAEEPCFPGCLVPARLLGVMEVEQTAAGRTYRNDRLIAVADAALSFPHLGTVDDLPRQVREEISTFFATYHSLQNKTSRTLAWEGPERARKLLAEAQRLFSYTNPLTP